MVKLWWSGVHYQVADVFRTRLLLEAALWALNKNTITDLTATRSFLAVN